MRYERPWQGDAIATPVCARLDREDGIFEGFGGNATQHSAFAEPAETPQNDAAGRPGWGIAITLMLGTLWSSIRRRREMHRIQEAWDAIVDRTLHDIGVSRYELERARDPRGWM